MMPGFETWVSGRMMVSLTEIDICGEETGFLLSFEAMIGRTGKDETKNGNQKGGQRRNRHFENRSYMFRV